MATNLFQSLFFLTAVLTTCMGVNATTGKSVVEANFDDLNGTIAASPPVPVPYKFLSFGGFSIGAASPVSVVALRPSSLQNFGVHSVKSLTTARISSSYPGSKIKSFDLLETDAGCFAATGNGAAAPPVNCTLTFTGTVAATGKTRTAIFNFGVGNAAGIGLTSMTVQHFAFPTSFAGLSSVVVVVSNAVIPPLDSATVQFAIDNVRYTLYTAK